MIVKPNTETVLRPLNSKEPATQDVAVQKRFDEAAQVAKDFEGLFMDSIVKGMRKTIPTEESSNAMGIYNDMLDSERAKTMTQSQDFGIRRMILDWITQNDPTLAARTEKASLESLKSEAQKAYSLQSKVLTKP
jgi:Rod binding domain-containing protein